MPKKVFIPTPEQLEEMGFIRQCETINWYELHVPYQDDCSISFHCDRKCKKWNIVLCNGCIDGCLYQAEADIYPTSLESLKEFISNFQE